MKHCTVPLNNTVCCSKPLYFTIEQHCMLFWTIALYLWTTLYVVLNHCISPLNILDSTLGVIKNPENTIYWTRVLQNVRNVNLNNTSQMGLSGSFFCITRFCHTLKSSGQLVIRKYSQQLTINFYICLTSWNHLDMINW